MAIEMVRIPSETPNISNTDDFVGLRYAYGNQNGYVIGKGQECSYTISGAKFRVNSGRLVLQGVECDIDANGVEITIDNVATKKYYTVYLQVNLATNETKILAMSDTSGYPTIESGDDLTQNTTGIAKMELYHFDATSGVISNVQKVMQSIKYIDDLTVDNAKHINGIEIIKDNNGVLKIGNEIISRKILLNANSISFPAQAKYHIYDGNELKQFNKFEIVFKLSSYDTMKFSKTFYLGNNIGSNSSKEILFYSFDSPNKREQYTQLDITKMIPNDVTAVSYLMFTIRKYFITENFQNGAFFEDGTIDAIYGIIE